SPFYMLGHVVMQQSYICALIAMMVWSITYHSWLTFVLLLWACLIWILRNRRQYAMLCSPFILLYGLGLCSLQYVWGMDLEPELPTHVGLMSVDQLGLQRSRSHCLNLGAMLLFTLTYWLLLRQFVREKFVKRKAEEAAAAAALVEVTVMEPAEDKHESLLKLLGKLVMGFYAKYWIYVCGGMFIVVSFTGRLVVYKIVYMFLFLLCLTFYQMYYTFWRKLLKVFWWLVVAYTMLVLIAVYTFQFHDFPAYWKNFTGFTDEQFFSIGCKIMSLSKVTSQSSFPSFHLLIFFLVCVFVYLNFLFILRYDQPAGKKKKRTTHKKTQETKKQLALRVLVPTVLPDRSLFFFRPLFPVDVPSKWGLVVDRLLVLFHKFSEILALVQVFVWRLLELHILKLVALYAVWVALMEVSVMNFLFVVFWAFAMPYCRFRHMASCLSTIWVCIIIVCKMLYQLKVVDPLEYSNNCTEALRNNTNLLKEEMEDSTFFSEPVDPANWFGFKKGFPILSYIQTHLLLLMLLVFEVTVYRHQEHHRKQYQLVLPTTRTLFEDISCQHMNQDVPSCVKYFVNYYFYKFGIEICLLMMVNVIGQRMNFMAIAHGCWLVVILTRRRREAIAKLWPKYCLFLVLFLLYQYLLCVGMPPALCIDYPWRWNASISINSGLIKWFYLPDFHTVPKSINLINDFLLLICASQQWIVFVDEKKEEWIQLAGENTDEPDPIKGKEENPVPNFMNCRCYLDMVKVVVFRYQFWFVLAVVFVTGATRTSIFGLCYLLACFYLLLFGTALLQKPAESRLALWDCLILYNIAVIISKNMLSLLSCVFVKQMQNKFCWVIQLFSLVCTVKGYYNPKEMNKDEDCSLPVEEAGIIWDSVCFFFLLLQRRVFLSFYFLHVTADLKASALQASRGFQLFKASMMKNMNLHQDVEQKSIVQLKRQMERIRSKQQKHREVRAPKDPHGSAEHEPIERDGSRRPLRHKKKWWRPWLDHAAVLHSGDYYLFESDSEEDEEAVGEEQKPLKQSAFQLAYQAWVINAKSALRERRDHQKQVQNNVLDKAGDRDQPDAELLEEEEEPEEEESGKNNVVQRILEILRFLLVLFTAMLDGLTQWLNSLTRQHVNTSTVLWIERFLLTKQITCVRGQKVDKAALDDLYQKPEGSEVASQATAETAMGADESQQSVASSCEGDVLSTDCTDGTTPLTTGYNTRTNSKEQMLDVMDEVEEDSGPGPQGSLVLPLSRSRTASELLATRVSCFVELEESERFYRSQNRCLKLIFALYNAMAAHSELVCYFVIILNNMVTASVISLVLPILIFLWAMLSIPRPSKRFWMTAIIYTEVMVVIKYLFQFGFFPWNSYYITSMNKDKPFFAPRILGLEKTENYIKYDLIQLMMLFFHRSLLRRYGLWDHEEKTCTKEKKEKEPEATEEPHAGERPSTDHGAVTTEEASIKPDPEMIVPPTQEGKGTLLRLRRKKRHKEPLGWLFPAHNYDSSVRRAPSPIKRCRFSRAESEGEPEGASEKEVNSHQRENKVPSSYHDKCINFGNRFLYFCCRVQNVYSPIHKFFHDILHTEYRAATDVYSLMFLADVVDFIIIIFGFWAFGKHSAAADIASSLSDDQVPEAFLVMLLIQFSTMVIDRALYLRKTVLGKLIFQIILVFGIHFWMFFILPAVTERMFSQNTVAQLWYFVKCIYFALSAYQIRCGYPTRILGNFLTKKYNHLNLFLFQGFRLVPFLVELRAVMDWVCTDTTLSLSNWMCVEDIYANIFIIKCSRETEKKYPQPKGQKKKKIVKYGMGGLIVLFLICIIWFPLLFMSLVRSVVGVVNHPVDVTVTLKLGGYEPLFTMSAQQQSIIPFTQREYDGLTKKFEMRAVAMQFITLYSYEDIVTANIEGNSGSVWGISPPSREQMIKELQRSSADITLRFMWTFQRNRDLGKGGTVETTQDKHIINLEAGSTIRTELADLLLGQRSDPVCVPNIFPKYIRAPNGPEAKPVQQLYPENEDSYLDVEVQLRTDNQTEWWVIRTKDCPQEECSILPMVIFSDKVSPPSLGFLAGYGIMGLYVSIVLVIGKFVRGFFSEISHSIMFEELPCVDRILKLCHDIFLVRETGELELEEELYAKLIFLYRSPETMIKWTREKE
uniref:Piezo type mechanosensitive ion channel component 1 (Er blood group) n=1 Tax=Latimeria chalumnae TaxID=7897 RepID=H3AQB6_LATCH